MESNQTEEIDYYNKFWRNYNKSKLFRFFQYHLIYRVKAIQKLINDNLSNINLNEKAKLLEVGCGIGLVISNFKNISDNITGIDYSKTAIEIARKNNLGINFYVVNIMDSNQIKKVLKPPYDIIISTEVIEHIKNKKNFLLNIHSLLASNGFCIITTPNLEKCQDYGITGLQFREEFLSIEKFRELCNGFFEIQYVGSTYFEKPKKNFIIKNISLFIKVRILKKILDDVDKGLYMVFLLKKCK